MKRTILWAGGISALLLSAVSGCYTYPPPPAATSENIFSQRVTDQSDDMFKDIKLLTLRQAQQIAIKNNPTYIAAYYSVVAAHMRYLQAFGGYAPTISAGFQLQNSDSWITHSVNNSLVNGSSPRTRSFSTNTSVTATLLLFDGFARELGWMIAEHSENYQKLLEEDQCRTMMQSVAYAYNTVLLAIENRRIASEDRKFQLSSLEDTQHKFEAGAVPLSDVLNFEILMNNADVDMINADYQYEVAVYALAVLMGYPDGTLPAHVEFPTELGGEFPELDAVEVYLDAALANRPDLKAYREQLTIARYQMYQTYSAYSPTVNAFASFGYDTGLTRYSGWGSSRPHSYSESPSFGYGISANWTIFNGFTRYNTMREYQALVAVADYQVAAQWFTVVGEVRSAYANYVQSVRQTRIYERSRDLSAKQRDLVDEQYRAGDVELTRLNEAQRDFVSAETNLASSYINIQNAKAQLDAAVGANSADYYITHDSDTGTPGLQNVPRDASIQPDQTNPVSAPSEPAVPAAPAAANDSKPAAAVSTAATEAAESVAPAAPVENTAAKAADSAAPAIPDSPTAAPAGK